MKSSLPSNFFTFMQLDNKRDDEFLKHDSFSFFAAKVRNFLQYEPFLLYLQD